MLRRIIILAALILGAAVAQLATTAPGFAAAQECPLGFQKMSNGAQDLCIQVCPLGQELNATGQCGPIVCQIKGQVYDATTGQCSCPPGQMMMGGGDKSGCRKACPNGQAPGPTGACGTAACTIKGQIYDATLNACICPPGTVMSGNGKSSGQCINPCPKGQKLDSNNVCSGTAQGPAPAATAAASGLTTSAFNGVWITRTSQGGDFVITLSVDPNGVVSGTFVEKNPKYNGMLQGQLDQAGTGFDYTYRETVTGFTGRGAFKVSADGKSLTGSVINDSDPKTVYGWSGTKQQ